MAPNGYRFMAPNGYRFIAPNGYRFMAPNGYRFMAPNGYRFMDMSIRDIVLSMVSCPQCFCTSLNLVENRKQGLAFELKLVCSRLTVIDAIYCGHQRKDQEIMMLIAEYLIQCVFETIKVPVGDH